MMRTWAWILVASLIAHLTKLVGFLVPRQWLSSPGFTRVSGALTISLLAALIAANTFAQNGRLVPDARFVSLVAAAIALRLRVPFLGVVVIGALCAAGARWLGIR